ncbi:MAG: minor capsid protein [Clostridium sp.]|uniref:minor capsid protein n=1 Tax=Clostridium TaxID=1485 RepID=UPI00232CF38E|nr:MULTISPECIES: minor capsid protein [Clostridium]MDB2122041.1 minor capsid protein [Clostridium paraputrificum]MDU2756451.1 minor capsid protein [Clostridium sp.]MDU2902012.1 minor capsid protein [Clostridium sp.]MDU4428351.1 minor capsid protein [Clostridium sp.]MDU7462171.1 minor capsid protein [Clostridium sp.]
MNNYWKDRELEKLKLEDIYLEEQIKKMSSLINKVISDIDTEIAKLYLKYSKDNGISYQDALIYLKDDERKEFQKDLKYYVETCRNEEKLDKYRQELQALSTRARVKRLEVLKAKIRMGATDIEGFLKNDNVNVLKDIYSESYLHSMFSMEGAKGIEVKFNEPNLNNVKKLLEHPWSGKNYSSKIWDTTGNFVNKMDSIVTTGLIQGKSYNVIARELERAKVGKNSNGGLRYQCERLIRTEAAFITEQATKDSYEKYGVEEYEYSATLDLRTSEICSELDNKVFKVSEAITGVNYPPMHVNCRSTTVPVVRWEGEETEDDVRIYRDPITGKNNYAKVRDYTEWKDRQYDKYGEDRVNAEKKKIRNRASDKLQFDKYRKELGVLVPSKFDEFQEIKYNNKEIWDRLSYNYKLETIYNLDKLKHTENFASKYTLKHIFEGELNLRNPRRPKAVGFHLESMPTRKGSIIEDTRSLKDKNGVYEARVIISGVAKLAKSTFFPISMTPQQIVNAINEAYSNKIMSKRGEYIGITSAGLRIGMYIDSNGKITTAYPKKEEI